MKKLGWALGSAAAFFFAASLLVAAQQGYPPIDLGFLDANKDGRLNSSDVPWKVLYLVKWEGRGRTDKKVFPLKGTTVSGISAKGGSFVRADGSTGRIMRVYRDAGGVLLEGGFYLALDTTAFRASGYEIRAASGELLNGIRPIQSGWHVRAPSGKTVIVR